MSFTIDQAFVNQYRDNVQFLVQQKGSRLRPFVRQETQHSEFEFYDRIGSTQAQKITGRHQDTPLVSTNHDRRRCGVDDYDWADLIDRQDKLKTLIDPTSAYAQNAMWAMGRAMDDEILAAAFGTAYSGQSGATAVTFPSSQVVAVNDHTYDTGSGNVGLTISKLQMALRTLQHADADDDELKIIAVTSKQIGDLLATTQVSNIQYKNVRALAEGAIDTFMGFKFVRTERVLLDGSGYYRIPVWVQSGLLLATAEEVMVDIGPRRDKRNSMQVYVSMSIGAVRMEELKVVEIKCA